LQKRQLMARPVYTAAAQADSMIMFAY
jgi:hypothetical protein